MIMRRFSGALCVLCLLFLFLGGFFWGFEKVALDSAVYDRIQAELDVYKEAGLSPEAQSRVNQTLAGYLRGEVASLDIQEEVFGVRQEVFNSDEKAHMVDVLNLFQLERELKVLFLFAGGALTLLLCLLRRGQSSNSVCFAVLFLLGLVALISVFGITLWKAKGFDALFLAFHHLFFSNDLWLMDPRTDAMIRMLPGDFFLEIAAEAGKSALIHAALLTAGGCLFLSSVSAFTTRLWRRQTK